MAHPTQTQEPGDFNLVEIWLRKDPTRWVAGAFAGFFAGVVMIGFSMVLASLSGNDLWYPVKLAAVPFLGGAAMEYDAGSYAVLVGFAALQMLFTFLGVVYSHFTGTNSLGPLFGVGLTWGAFGWIFINNLFINSWRDMVAVRMSNGAAFFSWIVFGIALTSVSFFDRMLRGTRN